MTSNSTARFTRTAPTSAAEFARRFEEMKRFTRFGDAEAAVLRELCVHAKPHFADIAREFYERVREHEEAHAVFEGEAQIARLHGALVNWLERVLTGPYDAAYCAKSLRIGRVHVRVGLEQRYMFAAMDLFRLRLKAIAHASMGDQATAAASALARILDIELALMNESFREAMTERAERLRQVRWERDWTDEAQLRYVHAVELAGVMIIVLDREGRVRLFNREAEQVTGYPFAEIIGESFVEVLCDEEEGQLDRVWARVNASKESSVPIACAIRTRRGRLRDIVGQVSRARDNRSGDLIVVARDVTDEVALAARLRQSEKLAAVGTLAAGLAHEIRNPLNGAQLHVTFLRRALAKLDGDEELVEAVDVVASEIKRLSALVTDFLDFARPTRLNLKPVQLQDVCRRASDLVDAGGKELRLELPETALLAHLDVEKLEQVLLNLLSNALDAAPDAGHVTLRAYREPRQAVVEVRDDGPGLANPDAPIFDAFFSTKEGGTGLGLAIVHRIVSDHGGSIVCLRAEGQTVFRVTLPLEPATSEDSQP